MNRSFFFFVFFILYSVCAQAAEPTTPPTSVTVNPTPVGYPQPVIIFNYGTYNSGPQGPSLLSTPPLSVVPTALEKAAIATTADRLSDYTNGFGLKLAIGNTGGDSARGAVGGAELDLRFVDYLGLEAQLSQKLGGGSGRFSHYYAGPKLQIPFKSSLLNFTPSAGVGYGEFEMGTESTKGLTAYLRAEFEFFNLIVVGGTYLTTLSGNKREYLSYTGSYLCSSSNYYCAPDYSSSYSSSKYSMASVRAGIRIRPQFQIAVDFAEHSIGPSSRTQLSSLILDMRF